MSLESLYTDLGCALQVLDPTYEYVTKTGFVGTTGVMRAPHVELSQAIDNITKAAGTQMLTTFEIYADTLTAEKDVILPDSCMKLLIVARRAFVQQAAPITLIVNPKVAFGLRLVKDDETAPIHFRFVVGGNEPLDQSIAFTAGSRGVFVTVDASRHVTIKNDISPLVGNFEYMTALEAIQDNGEFLALGFDESNDHLPKLLDFQLLLAARNQTEWPELTYDIAKFVQKVTSGVPKALDYNSQASTILGTYFMNSDNSIGQYLSPLNVDLTQEVLSSRLLAASNFEASYKAFVLQAATSENIQTLAKTALNNATAAQATYDFLEDQASANFEAAHTALILAQNNFQQLQSQLDGRQKAFQDGIEAWKNKMIIQAVVECVVAVALIAGSIAVAVVAPPAGAAIATGTVGELSVAVKVGDDVAKKMSDVVGVVNKLKFLFSKMKPGLEKIDKLITAIKNIVALMKKFKRINASDTDLAELPQLDSDDLINGLADWDVFSSDMSSVWDMIAQENIRGSRDFFTLLQEMAIRGKAVYSAQYALVTLGQTLTASLARGQQNQNETKALQNAVTQIANNQANCQILKLALLDRLIRVRSFVLFDFRNYAQAYAFYALDLSPAIVLDPLKDMEDFLSDAATLQNKVAKAKATVNAQRRKFVIHDTDEGQLIALNQDWQATLKQQRIMSINVLPSGAIFAQRGRIRIIKFSLFLEGAVLSPGSDAIRLNVNFGRDLKDLSLTQPSQTVSFAGAETRASFEYASKTDIKMDGQLMYPQNAVAITPFTTWMITVDQSTDCSAVTGMTLELECEVTNLF